MGEGNVLDIVATIWSRLTKEIAESSPLDLLIKLVAAVVFLLFLYVARQVGRWLWPLLKTWWLTKKRLLARIAQLEARLNRGLGAVARVQHGTHSSEGTGVWQTKPIQRPWSDEQYRIRLMDSIPIWIFANNKGGVAKTTNACNLAAHYAMLAQSNDPPRKPVLLLDLDYQGSSSSMSASNADRVPRPTHDSLATKLVSGALDASHLLSVPAVQHPDMVGGLPLRIVPAYYDLALAENRLLIEWLFGENPPDVRYQLARILHDPVVQSNFSRVIIDAPPRLTTACVQALCAATHVIIPTILDRLSGEAVGSFVGQLETLKTAAICPYLRYGGIVGYRSGAATVHVPDAEDSIRDALRSYGLDEKLYLSTAVITHSPLLAQNAGQLIAYARTTPAAQVESLRTMFRTLAAAIEDWTKR
jgi:chromosome partitioning protein